MLNDAVTTNYAGMLKGGEIWRLDALRWSRGFKWRAIPNGGGW